MEQYRIVQTSDSWYMVEELTRKWVAGAWWQPGQWVEHWERSARDDWKDFIPAFGPRCRQFESEAAAQKWIDDKRKYPLVIKQPA